MASAGSTYRALAAESGVTAETIRTWLTQGQTPRIDLAERIAVALDVAPAWLAYGHTCKRNRSHKRHSGAGSARRR